MGPVEESFAGFPASSMSLWVPLVGLWVADVTLVAGVPLPPFGPLVHGNMALIGGVYRSATFGGQTTARIAGGFGGWSRSIPARGYSLPFGVTRSIVIADAAAECGEPPALVVNDTVLGQFWTCKKETAGMRVRTVAGSSWWVNPAGILVVGPRDPSPIITPWQQIEWDGASGVLEIATNDPASWQPGRKFASPLVTSPQTVSAVRHIVSSNGRSRMRVMVSP